MDRNSITDDFFKLDPSIFRTMQERIEMVTHPDCDAEVLKIVAMYDTDTSVTEACAFNPNASTEVIDIVCERLNKTRAEIQIAQRSWKIKNNPKFKDSFCVLPWVHAATNSNGSIRACCQMIYGDDEIPYGNITKDDGTPLTGADDIEQHRNAVAWKKLRSTMLEGKRHNTCKLCWDEEANKIESKRQQCNAIYNADIETMLDNTLPDGTIKSDDFPIKYWDLRFGNKCNIKCRTCGPTDSDQWYADWIGLGQGDTFKTKDGDVIQIESIDGKFKTPKVFDWVDDSRLWSEIQDNISNINRFYFTGGEPTVNLRHRQLLQFMIDNNVAKDIVLEYNTNMAGVPDSVFAQWRHFKEVHIGMSIDGIYEHFEYIRNPGKWSAVEKNLAKVDSLVELRNVTASFTVTLSIMNVLHILDMFWWMKEQKFSRIDKNIVTHNLYWPKFYNIQNLPNEVKLIITNSYNQFIDDIYKRWGTDMEWCKKTEKTLNSILTHMNDAEPDLLEFEGYFKRQDALDKLRKENWRESLSNIAKVIDYYTDTQTRKQNVSLEKTSKRK